MCIEFKDQPVVFVASFDATPLGYGRWKGTSKVERGCKDDECVCSPINGYAFEEEAKASLAADGIEIRTFETSVIEMNDGRILYGTDVVYHLVD